MTNFVVTTLSDAVPVSAVPDGELTLREAVAAANSDAAFGDAPAGLGADTITFAAGLAGGTLRLTNGEIEITDALTIDGDLDGNGTADITITGDALGNDTVDANGITRLAETATSELRDNSGVLNVTGAAAATTLNGLVLTGGTGSGYDPYGGAVRSAADLTITDSIIAGNQTKFGGFGGGVFGDGAVTLTNSTVSGNITSSDAGGGVYAGGDLRVTGGAVSGNKAGDFQSYESRGGGLYGAQDVTLTGTTISDNSTEGKESGGGGVFANATLTVTNSTVTGNSTEGDRSSGGGLYGRDDVTITGSTIENNTTNGDAARGGGVYVSGNLILTGSTVSDNSTGAYAQGAGGGGIAVRGDATVLGSTISGNATIGDPTGYGYNSGGGIYSSGSVSLTDSTVSNNYTLAIDGSGGGIYADGAVTLLRSTVDSNSTQSENAVGGGIAGDLVTLTDSTVSNNRTGSYAADGGGIFGQTVLLTNSTVAGNSVGGFYTGGGGIRGGRVELVNSTVTDNIVRGKDGTGGGIDASTVSLTNSIVAGNVSEQTVLDEIDGAIVTNVASIVGGDASTIFDTTDAETGGGVLADNGGPVQTVALLADALNIALDAGDDALAPATDARGEGRSDVLGVGNNGANVSDLGAFELADLSGVDPNAGPTAIDDAFSVVAGAQLTGNVLVDNGSGADSDPDGDALSVSLVTGPAAGTLALQTDGSFTFDAPAGAGAQSFTYLIEDGRGGSDTAVAELTVEAPTSDPDKVVGTKLDDVLDGGEGDSLIVGRKGDDVMNGNGGDDRVLGNAGEDELFGGSGDDLLYGGRDSDLLVGGAGDDVLSGDFGVDALTGGEGLDTFAFFGRSARETDIVTDFEAGETVALVKFGEVDVTVMQDGNDAVLRTQGDGAVRTIGIFENALASDVEAAIASFDVNPF